MEFCSKEANKLFESAPVWLPEGFPNRWERTSEVVPGATEEMVHQRHHDVDQIDSGRVSPPDYPDDSRPPSSANQPPKYCGGPMRKKRSSWSLKEHTLFLVGVEIYGKGKWKKISKNLVVTRSAKQVASHAQKFYDRQTERDTRVKSKRINDLTLASISPEYLNQILSSIPLLHHHHNPEIPSSNPNFLHQSHSSIHYHHRPLSMPVNHLAAQIPSSDLQSHQVHYDVPVINQSSPIMNQLGSQIPSGVHRLQKPYQPNSQVHFDVAVNQSSALMNQIGSHILPSGLHQLQEPYFEPNSQVHYDLPMHHQSLGMNQCYPSEPQVPYNVLPLDHQYHQSFLYNQSGLDHPSKPPQEHSRSVFNYCLSNVLLNFSHYFKSFRFWNFIRIS